MADSSSKAQASTLKNMGNDAFAAKKFDEAIDFYSMAIELDNDNHVLYSNRSVAYAKNGQYDKALEDAEKTITIMPDWEKGYLRKGSALAFLGKEFEALCTFVIGLGKVKDRRQLLDAFSKLYKTSSKIVPKTFNRNFLFTPFKDKNLMAKLNGDPRTRPLLSRPDYLRMIADLQENPASLAFYFGHPVFSLTMDVAYDGADIFSFGHCPPQQENQEDMPPENEAANKYKTLGNESYKQKDFEKALSYYNRAIAIDPTNLIYYNNVAAVYFEQKEYWKCILECENAINVGRENLARSTLIAKSFTRIGNAYKKLGNLHEAKNSYESAMSEFRTPEIYTAFMEVDKLIDEQARANVDRVQAKMEGKLGDHFLKQRDFDNAIVHFTKAIKHNPYEVEYYSARISCYVNLGALDLAYKDASIVLELDPKFLFDCVYWWLKHQYCYFRVSIANNLKDRSVCGGCTK